MKIGVIGVGHLAMSLLQGWRRAGLPAADVILSPRGYGPALADEFGYGLAVDSADLVRRADLVLLAVRPSDAERAIHGLPWQDRHVLVSACAGVGLSALAAAAPQPQICRIMPLTAAEVGASPTTIFPALADVCPLIARLGPVIPLAAEQEFETATVSAAVYGWALSLIGQSIAWSQAQGLPAATAQQLTAATFAAAGRMAAEGSVPDLLRDLVTPGGITERGLNLLAEHETGAAWDAASDAVLAMLTRRA